MEYRCKDELHDKYKDKDIILPINSPPFFKEACPAALSGRLPQGWLYLAVLPRFPLQGTEGAAVLH